MLEPFAIQIYRKYLEGATVEKLAAEYGISAERIEVRLRAAADYLSRRFKTAA